MDGFHSWAPSSFAARSTLHLSAADDAPPPPHAAQGDTHVHVGRGATAWLMPTVSAAVRRWLLFDADGDDGGYSAAPQPWPPPPTAADVSQGGYVGVHSVCESSSCDSAYIAHRFHRPMLWRLQAEGGRLYGVGWVLDGSNGDAPPPAVLSARYALLRDEQLSACVYAVRLSDSCTILAELEELDGEFTRAVYTCVRAVDGTVTQQTATLRRVDEPHAALGDDGNEGDGDGESRGGGGAAACAAFGGVLRGAAEQLSVDPFELSCGEVSVRLHVHSVSEPRLLAVLAKLLLSDGKGVCAQSASEPPPPRGEPVATDVKTAAERDSLSGDHPPPPEGERAGGVAGNVGRVAATEAAAKAPTAVTPPTKAESFAPEECGGQERRPRPSPPSPPPPAAGGGFAPPPTRSTHVCECKREFRRMAQLKRHVRSVHAKERPYHCAECRKSFSQSGHLNEHVRVFHSHSCFRCEVCGKSFGVQSKMRRHYSAVHMNLREHRCELCGKLYKEKGHLKKHMRAHGRPPAEAAAAAMPARDGGGEGSTDGASAPRAKRERASMPLQRPPAQRAAGQTPYEERLNAGRL